MTHPRWGQNPLCQLLSIEHPIIQGGMVWVSGGKLAAAASQAGCLGVIGAGSLSLDLLRHHIRKAKTLTQKPIALNVPQIYKDSRAQLEVALEEGIRIFITSAGSPKIHVPWLKDQGALCLHVTSHPALVLKCADAGCDGVIVEGFEAGGHNGRDELTTQVLLQQVRGKLSIPVVAAGGIGSGAALLASLALGASGVQIGTLFTTAVESSAHTLTKEGFLKSGPSDTHLCLKKLAPVRLLKNNFARQVFDAEDRGAPPDELEKIAAKGLLKQGLFLGDFENGKIEIGQIVSECKKIQTVAEIVEQLLAEFDQSFTQLRTQLQV